MALACIRANVAGVTVHYAIVFVFFSIRQSAKKHFFHPLLSQIRDFEKLILDFYGHTVVL